MSPSTRADAVRNRELLLETARAAFAAADDSVPLETIARSAGVGIGTLYRHFPSREELVEAVYEAEIEDVVASGEHLLREHPADVALRAWFDRYATFIATKRGIMGTLRAGWSTGRLAAPTTRQSITGLIARMLAAGSVDGTLRADIEPDDVTTMLLGLFLSVGPEGSPDRVARALDLLVDAVRR